MIRPRTVHELAGAMLGRLETAIRFTGSEFIVLKRGSPEWMRETSEMAFNAVFQLSGDDYAWQFLAEALTALAKSTDPGEATIDDHELFHDRVEWLASDPSRATWCDAYTEEAITQVGGGTSLAEILREGMWREKQAILDATRTRLAWLAENYEFGDSWRAIDSDPRVSTETKP
jgi:hypothetical protein